MVSGEHWGALQRAQRQARGPQHPAGMALGPQRHRRPQRRRGRRPRDDQRGPRS